MGADDRFERDLPGAMRSAVAEFRGPSPDLIERGIRRGRRQRRARVAVGAAVAAVLVLGGSGGLGLLDGVFAGSSADSGPAARRLEGMARLPVGRELVPYVRAALPDGGRTGRFEPDHEGPGPGRPRITGTYTGANGSTGLEVELSRPLFGSVEDLSQSPHCPPEDSSRLRCVRTVEPDGGVLEISGFWTPGAERQSYTVVYTRPDGVQVRAGELVDKPKGMHQALGPEELTAIAHSPVWTVVGVDSSDPAPAAFEPVSALLPKEIRIQSAAKTTVGNFVLGGLHGAMSDLTVRLRSTRDPAVTPCPVGTKEDFCVNVTLADGTPGVTHQVLANDGRVESRSLLVIRPGGLALSLEVREGRGADSAPLPEPLLSIEQLKTMAASPRWSG
ncbi:hypothetical protein OG948_09940 [Embleya sp. NBC_00888]|uniref:hypothetical protein n=1 Tax=Embleya sp. NBC_00888 TaxID=2975960 RepID=UPI00386FB7D4|nr:hypothetical protein OG948_09940 [Embleya sp. NBC_00888]